MAIIMGKGCLEAIYGLMGWKGLKDIFSTLTKGEKKRCIGESTFKDVISLGQHLHIFPTHLHIFPTHLHIFPR